MTTDRKLYWATLAAAVLGIAVSIYMTIFKLTSNEAMCLGNGGCSIVNASKYSEIYGIPLGIIGLLGYGAIAVVLFLEDRSAFFKENGPLLQFGMGLVGFLYSLYLTYLEAYVIHAFCPFCVASAILITLAFIIALIRLIRQFQN
jgi:uncharacterized membrane protein